MSNNVERIGMLSDASTAVEAKITQTTKSMQTSTKAAKEARHNNDQIRTNIEDILDRIAHIEKLSDNNSQDVEAIEREIATLMEVASSLQAKLNEFKS